MANDGAYTHATVGKSNASHAYEVRHADLLDTSHRGLLKAPALAVDDALMPLVGSCRSRRWQ